MSVIDFYTRVLKSLDVNVVDGYLRLHDGDKEVNFSANGTPLVLPVKEHLSTLLEDDGSGNITQVKRIYNPLDETVIKGDSVSLTKTKLLTQTRLASRICLVGSLLLKVAAEPKHQSKTTMLVNQFLGRLGEVGGRNITKLVDDDMINKWSRLYTKSLDSGAVKLLTVHLKKGGKIGTTRYNRVATFKSAVYVELNKIEKTGKINGVGLRGKDVKVFKILIEYLCEGISDRGVVNRGSNDNESPGFISLYTLYLEVMGKIQKALSGIEGVDPEMEDGARLELGVDVSELATLHEYARELAGFPREGDVVKTKLTNDATSPTVAATQPAKAESVDAVHKVLYGGMSGVLTPPMQQAPQAPAPIQQPQQPQQQPYQPYPAAPAPMYNQAPAPMPGYMPQAPMPGYGQFPAPNGPQPYRPTIGAMLSTDPNGGGATVGQPMGRRW